MSRSLNEVKLLGHLGQDINVRYTPSGVQVGTFSIATTRRWKQQNSNEWQEATDWHNCVLWRCENLVNYLTKGKQVLVSGRLQTRSYEKDGDKRYVTEVVVEDLYLLGGGKDSEQRQGQSRPSSSAPPSSGLGEHGITDEDVPF